MRACSRSLAVCRASRRFLGAPLAPQRHSSTVRGTRSDGPLSAVETATHETTAYASIIVQPHRVKGHGLLDFARSHLAAVKEACKNKV